MLIDPDTGELLPLADASVFMADDLLGESPHWNPVSGLLSRVDIHGGRLRTLDPITGVQTSQDFEAPLSFALPREAGGYVLGVGLQVVLLDTDGSTRTLVDLSSEIAANRFNDAVCDAKGRLWAGTMSLERPRATGSAALFRIEIDGSFERVLSDLTLSNGMDWPDSDTLLHIDSDSYRIDRYSVDTAGRLGERTVFAETGVDDGLPDGLTIDEDGGVWVAFFGGGVVRRWAPDGHELERVRLPFTCASSVAFGGPDLRDLYVTSSRHRLSDEQVVQQVLAGSVLRLRPGVRGRVGYSFGA
ncbi:MAG: SMP-30/gluconolactonase/LRE family protein [Actinomycetes bacterium]